MATRHEPLNLPADRTSRIERAMAADGPFPVGGLPSEMTPESLKSFLSAAAAELTRILPELQVALGKIEAAKTISEELWRREVRAVGPAGRGGTPE